MAEEKFKEAVEKAMDKVVKSHQHHHPLYRETCIQKYIIDEKNQRAAFVLFEQIDTDRCTPEGEGWLGDQYRYSVWFIKEEEEPKQLYEDHAYIRRTKSALTGSRGRDPCISLEELLEDGVIAAITPKDAESAYGNLSQTKVKITLDGKIEEPEDFIEQAKNLVKRIGPKLGYDYMRSTEKLERKNVAAIVWGTENGSTYGYNTVYLVWKDKSGELRHKVITDSRDTKDYYLNIDEVREAGKNIVVKVRKKEYKVSKEELNLSEK